MSAREIAEMFLGMIVGGTWWLGLFLMVTHHRNQGLARKLILGSMSIAIIYVVVGNLWNYLALMMITIGCAQVVFIPLHKILTQVLPRYSVMARARQLRRKILARLTEQEREEIIGQLNRLVRLTGYFHTKERELGLLLTELAKLVEQMPGNKHRLDRQAKSLMQRREEARKSFHDSMAQLFTLEANAIMAKVGSSQEKSVAELRAVENEALTVMVAKLENNRKKLEDDQGEATRLYGGNLPN